MIRLAKLTDYAMLILSQMAKEPASVLSAGVIATALHLSTPTVSKILKILSEAGFVSSIRGAEGGYRLAKEPKEISLADIIIVMEGDLAMTACCEKTDTCAISSACIIKENWKKINHSIYSMLANLTIIDMLRPLSLESHHVK